MAGTAPCGTPIDPAASYRVTITRAHPHIAPPPEDRITRIE